MNPQSYKSYFSSLSFDEQTSGYWVISLRAAGAERDADLTRIIFSLNSFYLFWPSSGLKFSTNELTS